MAALGNTTQPWPTKSSNATCNICTEITEENWENEEDDLLVCISPECKRRYRAICRSCMIQCHRKSGKHNMNDDESNFVHLNDWYNMNKIQKCDADHTGVTILKSGAKSVVVNPIGVIGGYALADKAVLQLLRKIPQDLSRDTLSKYASNFVNGMAKSDVTTRALVKNMAKSQALVNGVMFALEVGWNVLQYAYTEEIDYHELCRRNKKAGLAHGSGFVGAVIGGAIGSLGGPWGAFAGATILGMICDVSARKYFDSQNPNERKRQIQIALIRFDYGNVEFETVLKDEKNFNLQELQDRYHLKAPFNHPDGILKGMGKTKEELEAQWAEFYACYTVLLVLCKERDEKKHNSVDSKKSR